jgi:predicted metal-dependent phosphoesterase TrpH
MNIKIVADLHCHTNASDGLLSPSEVVDIAAQKGLSTIAITDHDTISGYSEGKRAASACGIDLITGIEINTDWFGKEQHILGYGFDPDSRDLNMKLNDIRAKRKDRISKIVNKLNEIGLKLSAEEVAEKAKGLSVGRPHVAQAMVNKGYARSVKDAFENYLAIGAKAYVPRYKLKPQEAINIINEAQGIAVLAHPGIQNLYCEIGPWIDIGLKGIEVYHPEHNKENILRYTELARKKGLIITGGSDFHGEKVKPGIRIGDWGVDEAAVAKLKALYTLPKNCRDRSNNYENSL